ncbi:hypothetical protein DIPPA_20074 [Diplonema papillatum]|nr:hypothetical protein DIPPA_20074 [Diplonema papillatum]
MPYQGAAVLAMICAVMLAAGLADGRSLFTVDNDSFPVDLGSRYGFGLFHDSRGYNYDEDGNPVKDLGCSDHEKRFQLVKASSVIAIIAAGAVGIVSTAVSKHSRVIGFFVILLSIVMFAFHLIALATIASLYDETFSCGSTVTQDLRLGDYFKFYYAFGVVIGGTVLSLLCIITLILGGAHRAG